MLDEVMRKMKQIENQKSSSEIGIIKQVKPHLIFTINGQEYSSEFFTVYVPAVDRIKQFEEILGDDLETDIPYKQQITVDVGDLELEPDNFERRFLVGDLVDITDRGDSFIIHNRLIKVGGTDELYNPTHRG